MTIHVYTHTQQKQNIRDNYKEMTHVQVYTCTQNFQSQFPQIPHTKCLTFEPEQNPASNYKECSTPHAYRLWKPIVYNRL